MQLFDLDWYEVANNWSGWIAACVGLAVFGVSAVVATTLLAKVQLRLPSLRWAAKVRKRAGARRQQQPVAAPVASEVNWQTISELIEARAERMRVISGLQARAAQGVEAAEYALNRLRADYTAVLLDRPRPQTAADAAEPPVRAPIAA